MSNQTDKFRKGRRLHLFVEVDGTLKSIAAATSCGCDLQASTTEITNKDTQAGMTDVEVTTLSGTLHTENMFAVNDGKKGLGYYDLFDLWKAGEKIPFTYQAAAATEDDEAPAGGWSPDDTDDDWLAGYAVITSLSSTAPNDGVATFSCDMTITGEVTHEQPAAVDNG